ncbi:MAG: hypothetical protein AB8G99_27080 [Planctomycetaceae bacterium]
MRSEVGDRQATFGQLRLNLNRFLDVERLPDRPADLIRGTLEYRPLTVHIGATNSDGSTSLPTLQNNVVTKGPFPPRVDQNGNGSLIDEIEYWARRDRQKMARDIYVLLYTLGGGNDAVNYTSSNLTVTPDAVPGRPPISATYRFYTQEQLRQMAQFAVNVVDALDRDNVATRFEYEKNRGDTINANEGSVPRTGWNTHHHIRTPALVNGDPVVVTDDGFAPWAPSAARATGLAGGYDGNFAEDSAERGVVYGVEKQELAFSEVLAIFQNRLMGDNPSTLYDDENERHGYLHVELQNLTNQPVAVATDRSLTADTAIYRIRSFNNAIDPGAVLEENQRKIALLRDAPDVEPGDQYTIATSSGNDLEALSGQHRPSDFFVDTSLSGSFERISPALIGGEPMQTTPANAIAPRADIDLVHARDRMGNLVFSVNGNAPGGDTEGEFMSYSPPGAPAGSAMFDPLGSDSATQDAHVLVLERRANPHMPELPLSENPWVEVDRTYAFFQEFQLADAGTPPTPAALNALFSQRRVNALEAATLPGNSPSASAPPRRNTIGAPNGGFVAFAQPHYDRDFSSLGELLHIPLVGPGSITSRLRDSLRVPSANTANDQVEFSAIDQGWATTPGIQDHSTAPLNPWIKPAARDAQLGQGLMSGANAKFLLADFPNTVDGTGYTPPPGLSPQDLDNRWYMLFAALEVPTRAHRQFGNPILNVTRKPGVINLNTIRHPEVLQALLDDPLVTGLDLTAPDGLPGGVLEENPPGSPVLDTAPLQDIVGGEAARDWMQQLIAARDGQFTPPSGAHTLFIPGLPGSRPFTPFGRMAGNDFSLHQGPHPDSNTPQTTNFLSRTTASQTSIDQNNTLLRALMERDVVDANTDGVDDDNSARRLFEVGNAGDFTGPGVSTSGVLMTPQTRHRLLSKVLNNSTTSSNTFVIHMTIGLFEVYEDPTTGAVRIGGQYDQDQDSTTPIENNHKRAVFVVDRSELLEAFDAGSGQLDYRRLIKHQATLQ